jgi:DNA-binding transcriptional ArsR family regulator/uncharacterized protein YndB with AHSA1/START domain
VHTSADPGLGLLGNSSRRAIFELLAQRPYSVGELAQRLPISRPAVSQHLRVLMDGGLVVCQAEGTRHVYRPNPEGVAALRAYLDRPAFQRQLVRAAPPTQRGKWMTTAATIPALSGMVTVDVPVEQAFRAFTHSFNTWWPPEFHIGQADMAEAILEPRVGGRWYERGVDGTECDWGRVLVWEPPHRLVVTWQINGKWQFDPDPDHASEIEVRFTADGPQTTVELEHRHIHRLVDGQIIYETFIRGGNWISLLERFTRVTANKEAAVSGGQCITP